MTTTEDNKTRRGQANTPGETNEADCLMGGTPLDPETCAFYQKALDIMEQSGLDFMVGGAYAFENYTGIGRHTKDLDIFVKPENAEKALEAFSKNGYRSEMTDSNWLGKAYSADLFVDFIFRSGNGVSTVDESWLRNAVDAEVLGRRVKVVPAEEMIWQKAFVMERERYDGADVAHLLHARAENLDWNRLLDHFGSYWRVLYTYLILFGFIYPAERDRIPGWVMKEMGRRLEGELAAPPPSGKVCQGTLISHQQFVPDVQQWGYEDVRRSRVAT